MAKAPGVMPRDWIRVGVEPHAIEAVVSTVYGPPSAEGGDLEVVYYDTKRAIIAEAVKWSGDHWEFVAAGPSGAYADRHDRYADGVAVLRRGRSRH